MDLTAHIMRFGLTRQETAIYLLLCEGGALSGYEAAKKTGISRSNAYTALAGLVEKGAANMTEDSATRYICVPPAEFCAGRIREMESSMRFICDNIPKPPPQNDEYITIKGGEFITGKMRSMIDGAQKRLYLSAPDDILEKVRTEIANAAARGLKVVLITESGYDMPGATVYILGELTQLRLIVDSSTALTGDVKHGTYSTALYSGKKNLVELIKESMKNEIKLMKIAKENGK